MSKRRSLRPRAVFFGLAVAGVASKAIFDQLHLPVEERTWHGVAFGVPYDFRLPTIERLRNNMWNKDTASILVPRAFGLGWDINFYPLLHKD